MTTATETATATDPAPTAAHRAPAPTDPAATDPAAGGSAPSAGGRPRTRVALLGCGRIARYFHLRALAGRSDVELVAVADPDPQARAAAADAAGTAAALADWRDALALPGLDAAVVCLPTSLHEPAAVAAFQAGLAVYVEKPLATDLAGAQRVADAWRAAGTLGATGYNQRFARRTAELAAALDARLAGRLLTVRTVMGSAPRAVPDWKTARGTGGGALLDLAVHHVDLVRVLLGEVVAVSAAIRSVRSVDDVADLRLTLADGLTVNVLASTSTRQADVVELVGDAATVVADRYGPVHPERRPATAPASRSERLRAVRGAALPALAGLLATAAPRADTSFGDALGAFAGRLAGLEPSHVPGGPATIADGVAGLAVVAAAEESARTGRTVPVDPVAGTGGAAGRTGHTAGTGG